MVFKEGRKEVQQINSNVSLFQISMRDASKGSDLFVGKRRGRVWSAKSFGVFKGIESKMEFVLHKSNTSKRVRLFLSNYYTHVTC